MSHFKELAKLADADFEDAELLRKVVTRCVGQGLSTASAMASASEAEFQGMFQSESGEHPELRLPGQGRVIAGQMHKAAVIVQQTISEASEKRLRAMVGGSDTDIGDRKRDRKRQDTSQLEALADRLEDRRKRRKDRYAMGRASSSSSSEGSFDVTDKLKEMDMASFPTWVLPEGKALKRLARQMKRRAGRYVAEKPFDEWVPAHVGKLLPSHERKQALKKWERECTKDITKVLEAVQCFWLAHCVTGGGVLPQTVQAHSAVLSKMYSDYDLEYVVQYERHLHAVVLDKIAVKEKVNFRKLLGSADGEIMQRILTLQTFRSSRNQRFQPQPRAATPHYQKMSVVSPRTW